MFLSLIFASAQYLTASHTHQSFKIDVPHKASFYLLNIKRVARCNIRAQEGKGLFN